MKKALIGAVFLIIYCGSASADWSKTCENPPFERVKHSVVRIEHWVSSTEGYRGTAWFVDKKTIATIEHVIDGMKFEDGWATTSLGFSSAEYERITELTEETVRVRIKDRFQPVKDLEAIVLLELEHEVRHEVMIPGIKEMSLLRSEPVVAVAYKQEMLRFATGSLEYPKSSGEPDESAKKRPPYMPFELVDNQKTDRLVLDHGASGAPIFDCEGRVAAVVVSIMIQSEFEWAGEKMRITSPWGYPNIMGVTALPLLDRKKK